MLNVERNRFSIEDIKFKGDREMKKQKIWFRRKKEDNSRSGWGSIQSMRGWNILQGRNEIGFIQNVSVNPHSGDDSHDWKVWFYATGRNICMKARFNRDEIEKAKEYAVEAYETIMENKDGKYNDLKERLRAL